MYVFFCYVYRCQFSNFHLQLIKQLDEVLKHCNAGPCVLNDVNMYHVNDTKKKKKKVEH